MAGVYSSFKPILETEHIQTTLHLENGLIAECDGLRLEQVLANLISNAIKCGQKSPIEIVLKKEGTNARLSVRDAGPGINPDDQRRIFDRFERAVSSSDISGLGLGLFICRQIIELHKGSISVSSAKGFGTEFIALLPLKISS